YYTATVFECPTDRRGAQSAVFAGGRYDTLIENRGGRPAPAIGFAMGMERLVELVMLQSNGIEGDPVHAYMIDMTDSPDLSVVISEKLRDRGFNVVEHCGGGKLGNRLKRADQSGAVLALIRGQEESESGVIQLKHLRKSIPQANVPLDEVVDRCVEYLA
ncbi:MAG: histidine--tRNA ligase, partial [Gammaproteobacteria bacterium]|nr:histidine--tRNA ligase [Gammaproteobacteria bacterium]